MPSINSRASVPPSRHASERDGRALFPLGHLDFEVNDVTDRCAGIKDPLSLFAPYPHEDWYLVNHDYKVTSDDEEEDQTHATGVDLERPITPIDEEVTHAPTTYNKLAKLVRRRITAKTDSQYLSVDDQKELAAIVMGEVNGIWGEYKTQVNDPFLSKEENSELQRRITVHIVTVCGQLFKHYTEKAHILQSRGVFSGPANMSRLKAQLSLDTNKFLNISTIRRNIMSDLREESKNSPLTTRSSGSKKSRVPEAKIPGFSYKGLIAASRPKSKTKRSGSTTPSAQLKEMNDDMPLLETTRLETILRDLDSVPRETPRVADQIIAERGSKQFLKEADPAPSCPSNDSISEDASLALLTRSHSVPHLHDLETLTEVMGLEIKNHRAMSLVDEAPLCVDRTKKAEKGLLPGTREYAASDLKKLLRRKEGEEKERTEEEEEDEEDLAPLLQAVTRGKQHHSSMDVIDKQLKDLEKRELERIENEKIILEKETQPQPATVSTKLPNKMVVRTSDIRVSERTCLSSITLKKHETVYNDIIDEIDPATVKALDSNLFLGDEITEVYSEIMKTVPTDHLLLENDPLIMPTADAIDLTSVLASATLVKRPSERVINQKLNQQSSPPWGQASIKDWSKTPQSPPKDVKGRCLIMPMTPCGDGRAEKDFFGDGYQPPRNPSPPSEMHEVMARSYASWLQWWKNTLNTDDYMKYASTQETDFLGVVFHFYNSEDEDDDDDENSAQKEKRSRELIEEEKAKQMETMKNAKAEFKDGFWNVNSVLLGGLGNDPVLPDVAEEKNKASAETDNAHPAKLGKNRTHLVSRKILRSQSSGLGALRSEDLKSREVAFSPRSRHPGTKVSSLNSPDKKYEDKENYWSPQQKLEKVWSQLQMPDKQRLEMAIKYSSDQHYKQLEDAIESWEKVTEMILTREDLVAKLEKFERLASDPNRFFERGFRGSSVARLEEARIRSAYYKKIERLDTEIRDILDEIARDFQDTVTFQGRPYLDKIQWDRTEMLYWLQEERKQQAIDFESRIQHLPPLPVKMAHLGQSNPFPVQ